MKRRLVPWAITGVGALGCGAPPEPEMTTTAFAVLGDRLPGVGADLFAEAKAAFDAVEGITDGVGPIVNERACAACHSEGADGGSGVFILVQFVRSL